MKQALFCLLLLIAGSVGGLAHARDLFAPITNTHDFLKVDEAFEIQPLTGKDGQFAVSWRIAPGYFLYRPRLKLEVIAPAQLVLQTPELPTGIVHDDEIFGTVEVYSAPSLLMQVPVKGPLPDHATIKVSYQGCAEAGLCYPPQERVLEWTKR